MGAIRTKPGWWAGWLLMAAAQTDCGGASLPAGGRDGAALTDAGAGSEVSVEPSGDATAPPVDTGAPEGGSNADVTTGVPVDATSDTSADVATGAEAGGTAPCDAGTCVVASGLASAYGIAVDDGGVYFTDTNSVKRCPLDGCTGTPETLSTFGGMGIVVASGVLYWTTGTFTSAVYALALDGGATASLVSADPTPQGYHPPYAIAANAARVYWLRNPFEFGSGAIESCAVGDLDGATVTTFAGAYPNGSLDPFGLAVTATTLYYAENGTASDGTRTTDVGACGVGGCDGGATPLGSVPLSIYIMDAGANGAFPPADAIVADDASVYFVRPDPSTPGIASPTGSLMKCGALGCARAVTLAANLHAPSGLALDGANIYWANSGDGTVMKCAVAQCTPTIIASSQNHPVAVAVGSTSVYWTNGGTGKQDSSVMRAPK
jgi:hypothetical protein